MDARRLVADRLYAQPTLEGAGVRLKRAFGFGAEHLFDPFLMLDDFRGDDPADYRAGFPWHPHRGIETITYMLRGDVAHGDSLGNAGVIGAGDVQWMTAGSGIIHQEMPEGDAEGRMGGFQLWANLPAADKMMDPRYRSLSADDSPLVTTASGAHVRVIAGEVDGVRGPVDDVVIDPEYLDVALPAGAEFVHPIAADRTAFAYVHGGVAEFAPGVEAGNTTVVLFAEGDHVRIRALGDETACFLLISGCPLREPIAWRGPIVMNTDEELRTAFAEYREGTFVKVGAVPGA
ncbi:MAG: pirin family protein [Clostridiales bacterium]|nr:pirin family protein [Clostridiales bacterium]